MTGGAFKINVVPKCTPKETPPEQMEDISVYWVRDYRLTGFARVTAKNAKRRQTWAIVVKILEAGPSARRSNLTNTPIPR